MDLLKLIRLHVQGHKFKNPSCPLISYNKLVCSPFITSHAYAGEGSKNYFITSVDLFNNRKGKNRFGHSYICGADELLYILFLSLFALLLCVRIFLAPNQESYDERRLKSSCVLCVMSMRASGAEYVYAVAVLSAGLF
jgi:hypothetical protein